MIKTKHPQMNADTKKINADKLKLSFIRVHPDINLR